MDLSHLPEIITGPSAWVGSAMAQDESAWLYHLSAEEVSDLENAARHYLSLRRDVGEITAADFPLSTFAGHLKALQKKLVDRQLD